MFKSIKYNKQLFNLKNRVFSSKLFYDSFWALFGSVLGRGLSLLAGVLVARFLGKELFGVYGTIKNTLAYIAVVSTFGLGYTATKYIAMYSLHNKEKIHATVRSVYSFTLFFSCFLGFLLFVFSENVAVYLETPESTSLLKIAAFIVVFNALNASQVAVLSGFKDFKEIAKNNAISGILLFVFSVFLTYFFDIKGAIISLLISFIIQTLFNHLSIRKTLKKYLIKKEKLFPIIKDMVQFSLPIALQESLFSIVHWLGIMLLVKYGNYGEVGIYSVGAQWSAIVIFIPGVLKNVMFSHLTSAKNHKNLVNKLVFTNFMSAIVPILIIFVFSNFICSIYGDSFTNLRPVLLLFVSSSLFVSVSEVYCYEFISRGKTWLVFYMRFIRDSLIIIVSFVLITNFHSNQALLYVITSFFMNLLYLLLLFFAYKKSAYSKKNI